MSWKKSLGKNKFGKENFGDHVLEIFVPKLSNTFKIFQLLVKFFQVLVKFFQVLVNFFLTLSKISSLGQIFHNTLK